MNIYATTRAFLLLFGACILFGGQAIYAQEVDDKEKPEKGKTLKAPEIQYERERANSFSKSHSSSNIVYQEGFEGSVSGWSTNGTWGVGEPTSGPTGGFNSSNAAGTNLSGSHPNSAADTLVSPSISLPQASSQEQVLLHVREWYEIESGYDQGAIEISTDGGSTWDQLGTRDGSSGGWRDIQVDLTQYAGQNVKLAFRFTSDGSNTNEGWYLDDVQIDVDRPSPFSAEFTSINPQRFPFVFTNVVVDTFGTGIQSLSRSNFTIYEDGVEQKDANFEVTPPNQSGGVRQVDIIFQMDNSGSMSDEQNAVRNNVFDFVDSLRASGVDYRLGLTRFGQSGGSNPEVEAITDDATYFKNTIWARNVASGGTEPGWDAIYQSASDFSFRPGAQKIFIVITDEPTNGDTRGKSETEQILRSQSVTQFALIDRTSTSSSSDYGDLATATGGSTFDVTAPFDQILDAIGTTVSNSYVVKYDASDTQQMGNRRTVEVEVDYNGNTATDTTSYVVGASPTIARTNATRNLENRPWAQGTSFTIEAEITDQASPFVQGATLFYKNTSDSNYSSTSMSAVSSTGDTYEATIPGSDVTDPGVDYYITATDGNSTVSNPTGNPRTNPRQIAIMPNVAPSVSHTPVNSAIPGNSISIQATITDNTNQLASEVLFYREVGDLSYRRVPMTNTGGDTFEATIPGSDVTRSGVSYYIKATDDLGVSSTAGSAGSPIRAVSNFTFRATADAYTLIKDSVLSVTDRSEGVLANDSAFTATPTVVTDPQNGAITRFDSDGTFEYRLRTDRFVVADSFKYEARGDQAWARILVQPTKMQVSASDSFRTRTHRLVALPGQVDRPIDATLDGEAGTEWQSWRDKGSNGDAAEPSLTRFDGSSTFNFRPGRGFWLTSRQPWSVTDSIETVTLKDSTSSSIPLNTGWTVISNPFGGAVDWEAVENFNGDDLQPIWSFSGGTFSRDSTLGSAVQGKAYYFFNGQPNDGQPERDSLDIPYPGALETGRVSSKLMRKEAEQSAPLFALSATPADASHAASEVHVGVTKSEGAETFVVAPPSRFEPVSLRISSASSKNGTQRLLMTDVRSLSDAGGGHTFQLKLKSQTGGPVELKAKNLGALGKKSASLLYPSAGETYDLRENRSITVEPGDETTLQVAVGTKSYTKSKAGELLPKEVSLSAYPNPVRSQGSIVYELPEEANVTLRMYDVMGRKVATLVQARKKAGRHTVQLDTDRLASGVYFGRLRTGSETRTTKITVIR